MNVYDFDKTITDEDSSVLFIRYSISRYPAAFVDNLDRIIFASLKYAYSPKKDPTEMKESLFGVVRYIPDIDEFVKNFWKANRKHIKKWYLDRRESTDVIISASPEFLIAPVAEELGVTLIATPMSRTSGLIQGLNCKGAEKVRRFSQAFPGAAIDEFYSDSLSDTPMARLSEKAFLVRGSITMPWPGRH